MAIRNSLEERTDGKVNFLKTPSEVCCEALQRRINKFEL